jgi:small GTP-binding protein
MNRNASNSNHALLLTPPGIAAIAVVRCVGPAAKDFAQSHFSRPLQPGKAVHGVLRDGDGNEIDDPLIVLAADESFLDINLHGGAWVVRTVLELARHAGFEIVEKLPIQLPEDAIDSTEMIQREIDAYLPLATTEIALRTLLVQKHAWELLQKNIVAADASPRTAEQIDQILADRSLHWLLHPPRVAIIGAPNAGKSTLANQLFAQERSITADLPGTTRDWVGEIANLDGLAVQLIDTPGIRETSDEIESQAIARSAGQIQTADLTLLVLDASAPLEPEQLPLIRRYENALRIINKTDQPRAWNLERLPGLATIAGIDPLRAAIRQHFGCDQIDPKLARCWTERQFKYLRSR